MDSASPTLDELQAAVASRYAALRSYQDEGEMIVRSRPFEGSKSRRTRDRTLFRTAFVRPDRFRFEFRKARWAVAGPPRPGADRFVAWLEDGAAKSWWTVQPEVQDHDSILDALGGAGGISNGSSIWIPAMLIPGFTGWGIPSLIGKSQLRGREAIDGVECHRLEEDPGARGSSTLWIEAATYLVRRIFRRTIFTRELREQIRDEVRERISQTPVGPGLSEESRQRVLAQLAQDHPGSTDAFVSEATTTYRPAADVEILPEAFAVGPTG